MDHRGQKLEEIEEKVRSVLDSAAVRPNSTKMVFPTLHTYADTHRHTHAAIIEKRTTERAWTPVGGSL